MKSVFTISTITIDEEGNKKTTYYKVVAENALNALNFLVSNEPGLDVSTVDYLSKSDEIKVAD